MSSDKLFVLQLVVSGLRGVTRVILANNPLSGALILAALYWASPWQGLLGTLGVLASTLTAVIMGQDRWNTDTNKLKKVHIYDDMYDDLGVTRQANFWCLGSDPATQAYDLLDLMTKVDGGLYLKFMRITAP